MGVTVLLVLAVGAATTVLGRRVQLAREVHDEMGKVVWAPMSRVVRTAEVAALFLVAVAGLVILLDYGFSHLMAIII